MQNPHVQLRKAIFDISKIEEQSDEFFKEMEAQLEKDKLVRESQLKLLKYISPHKRAKKKLQLDALDKKIEEAEKKVNRYREVCSEEGGNIENYNQRRLDAAFAKAQEAHERIYLVYKHLHPHLLEEFTKIAAEGYDSEELEEFFANIARREAEELEEILASVKDDGISLLP